MSLWTLSEIAKAIGADKNISGDANGVSIDTRTLQPDDLFVALVGETDGAKFVDDALAKGAAAAICSENYTGNFDKVFVVKNPLTALQHLGAAARARTKAKVIAVTGSVGKTSTKEMLAHVFKAAGKTHATLGNLNNHFGLPLTLARMPADKQFAVLEMGMNHAGEITPLSTLARPDIAIITTVDAVHLAHFNGVEEIADAKAEIFAGLPEKTGIAILNRDNPHYLRLLGHAHARQLKVLSFGGALECDAQLLAMKLSATQTVVRAKIHGMEIEYVIGAPGAHWVPNSLAVLLAASAAGVNISHAALQLKTITPPHGRGVQRNIKLPGGGSITALDESYNASPISMAASLATLGQMTNSGRRIAALGDMKELGEKSAEYHRNLAGHIVENNIDLLFCAGELMRELFNQTPPSLRGEWAEDSKLLAAALLEQLRDGDVLLVKGSHSMKMNVILSVLENASEAA